MRVLFVEHPRKFQFVMVEYLPPAFSIIQLVASVERDIKNIQIEVLDCTTQQLSQKDIEKKIETFNPDIVAANTFVSCIVYSILRVLEEFSTRNFFIQQLFCYFNSFSAITTFFTYIFSKSMDTPTLKAIFNGIQRGKVSNT